MPMVESPLDSNGVLAVSSAHTVDQLTGVGVGFTILVLSTCVFLFLYFSERSKNNRLVEKMFTIIPEATAAVAAAANELREAYIEYLKEKQ